MDEKQNAVLFIGITLVILNLWLAGELKAIYEGIFVGATTKTSTVSTASKVTKSTTSKSTLGKIHGNQT